jgi:hypothetical protein
MKKPIPGVGVRIAEELGEVVARHVEAGEQPLAVAGVMVAEGAVVVSRHSSPADAARLLRQVADQIEAQGRKVAN